MSSSREISAVKRTTVAIVFTESMQTSDALKFPRALLLVTHATPHMKEAAGD
jgi:hypothetical protein